MRPWPKGVIHTEQATAIAAAVDALPAELADRAPQAEADLLSLANRHDARALRALGRHLLEVVAPDQADALIARHLDREEAEARTTSFPEDLVRWPRLGVRPIQGPRPDRRDPDHRAGGLREPPPTRPDLPRMTVATPQVYGQVYGQAFCELLEHLPPDRLPQSGGLNATVVVTMTLETLLGGLRAASILGTDTLLSPGQGPPPGRRSRRHPGRPGRPVPAPRPGPTTHVHPATAPRHGHPTGRGVQHRGL